MKKEKIVSMFAFGLMLVPVLTLQAEESGASVQTDVKVDSGFEGGPTRMPPVPSPDGKPGLFGNQKPPMEGEGSLRADVRANGGLQLTDEQKAKLKAVADARRADILAKIATHKDEVKVKLEAKAKERITKIMAMVFKRFQNRLDRLTNIDARIGTKITSLKTAGTDVTALSAQYALAQTALAKAKVDVEATSSLTIDATNTETSKETLHALVQTAEDSIKVAFDAYKKTIDLIPDVPASVEANSSTKVGQ